MLILGHITCAIATMRRIYRRFSSNDLFRTYKLISSTYAQLYEYCGNNPLNVIDPSGLLVGLNTCCCPLSGQLVAKCSNPPLITLAAGCKYPDSQCFAVCDRRGIIQCWPISCVCKYPKWADDKITMCLRGCLQCLNEATGKTPNIEAHQWCVDKCVKLYSTDRKPWVIGLTEILYYYFIWDAIVGCIKTFSPNAGSFSGILLPPFAVNCGLLNGNETLAVPIECCDLQAREAGRELNIEVVFAQGLRI